MATNLVTELERLASALESETAATEEVSLTSIADKIAKSLGVKADEVAILGISHKWKHLHFFVPESLRKVGFIPLSSTSAMAARTVREKRPEINNNFAMARHATVFEGVKSAEMSGESIQKIMSAPILCDGEVVGVMQVSRKGSSPADVGPDFTAEELGRVVAMCRPLGKVLKKFATE